MHEADQPARSVARAGPRTGSCPAPTAARRTRPPPRAGRGPPSPWRRRSRGRGSTSPCGPRRRPGRRPRQRGWTADSPGPPATVSTAPSPSASSGATCSGGRVPRHVRVVPLGPGQPAVGRELRGRVEVGARREDGDGVDVVRRGPVERDRDDRRDRLAVLGHRRVPVVLAHGDDHGRGPGVDVRVAVPDRRPRRSGR